jgi:hypothetical protein
VFFICLLLFSGLNNLAVCILRYRLKLEDAGKTAIQQFKWVRKSTLSLISPLKRKKNLTDSLLWNVLLWHLVQTRLFIACPLVFDKRELDFDLEGSYQIKFLPSSSDDPQTILGSNPSFHNSHCECSRFI